MASTGQQGNGLTLPVPNVSLCQEALGHKAQGSAQLPTAGTTLGKQLVLSFAYLGGKRGSKKFIFYMS